MNKNAEYKSTKEEYKIYWSLWIVGIVALPIIIWLITLIPCPFSPEWYLVNETHWLAFFGGYMGACIGILMTLYVMRKTLRQNQENHKELVRLQNETNKNNEDLNRDNRELSEKLNREQRQAQINTTLYVQEQANIEKLRIILDENYRAIDFQSLTIALNYVLIKNFDEAHRLLLEINKGIEMCGVKTELYLPTSDTKRNSKDEEYSECLEEIIIYFGMLVNDFLFIVSLLIYLGNDAIYIDTVKSFTNISYETIKKNSLISEKARAAYGNKDNIYEKILNLETGKTYDDTRHNIYNIIYERVNSMTPLHLKKAELIRAANSLLAYKETEAKKILLVENNE